MRKARVREIAVIAARLSGLPLADIAGKTRLQPIARVRQAVYLIAYEHGHSMPRIGSILRRDHSTVLHGRLKAMVMAQECPDYAEFIADLRAESATIREPLDAEWWAATTNLPPAKGPKPRRPKPVLEAPAPAARIDLPAATKKARNVFEPSCPQDAEAIKDFTKGSALLAAKMLEARAA